MDFAMLKIECDRRLALTGNCGRALRRFLLPRQGGVKLRLADYVAEDVHPSTRRARLTKARARLRVRLEDAVRVFECIDPMVVIYGDGTDFDAMVAIAETDVIEVMEVRRLRDTLKNLRGFCVAVEPAVGQLCGYELQTA